jgi:hypothetical protein
MNLTKYSGAAGILAVILASASLPSVAQTAVTINTSPAAVDKLQSLVTALQQADSSITEISVYGNVAGGQVVTVASTEDGAAGEPADPEDIEAMNSRKRQVSSEDGVVDVTTPLLNARGQPIAAVGVQVNNGGDVAQATQTADLVSRKVQTALQ